MEGMERWTEGRIKISRTNWKRRREGGGDSSSLYLDNAMVFCRASKVGSIEGERGGEGEERRGSRVWIIIVRDLSLTNIMMIFTESSNQHFHPRVYLHRLIHFLSPIYSLYYLLQFINLFCPSLLSLSLPFPDIVMLSFIIG